MISAYRIKFSIGSAALQFGLMRLDQLRRNRGARYSPLSSKLADELPSKRLIPCARPTITYIVRTYIAYRKTSLTTAQPHARLASLVPQKLLLALFGETALVPVRFGSVPGVLVSQRWPFPQREEYLKMLEDYRD